MGSWQLEVGRMMSYILFPIGIYYYFNQTENLEEWMIDEKKRYGPISKKQHQEFMQYIEKLNNEKRMRQLKEMEAQYNKQRIEQINTI